MVASVFATSSRLDAQFKFREPPNRQDPSALGEREGDRVWEQFLRNRHIGSFQLDGVLIYRPGRAGSRIFDLQLKGTWQNGSELTRVSLKDEDGRTEVKSILLENGRASFVNGDAGEDGQGTVPASSEDLNSRIFDALPFTWSDLLMSYLNWGNAGYEGPDRYLGRPAHRFSLLNPDPDSFPSRVVVTLDEDYAALLKADFHDADNALVKRLRVAGFKQFGNDWMFSELTWSNRRERESVTLQVRDFSLVP